MYFKIIYMPPQIPRKCGPNKEASIATDRGRVSGILPGRVRRGQPVDGMRGREIMAPGSWSVGGVGGWLTGDVDDGRTAAALGIFDIYWGTGEWSSATITATLPGSNRNRVRRVEWTIDPCFEAIQASLN